MINARAGLLALPLTLALSISAQASTVSLVPLQASGHSQVASLGASCEKPDAPAQAEARLVDYPDGAVGVGAHGVAQIGIELSPSGHLVSSWMLQSSGNYFLDRAAMESAKSIGYTAERVNCAPVSGRYRYEVAFSL